MGGVAVGEQTYRATERVFEYEPLEPVSVKGKAEPLALWRARAARARFGTDITRRYTTPLVGRELEKPLLIGTFERAAQQRSVQLVTIVGEPGVGKSRLVAELFAYLGTKPELTRWRQGRCLPYGEGITFWALGEIVKAEAGILESDSAEVAAAKLDAAVSPEEPERQWLLQRLAPLVGVEAASPAERQELFTAWRRYLEGLAAARPTVLVFEDLHWADEALLAFLEHLAEWAEGVPLLLLCTARPELYERHPGWAAGHAQRDDDQPAAALGSGDGRARLPPDHHQPCSARSWSKRVLERAGGNPLYAEEFVRLLADRGLGAGEMELPESLQALIAARLDTLSPERKSLLQDAAVLGKVFWVGALAEIGGRDQAELELALHELARKELVRPARVSSMEGESEYSFWHLLVRDVAYGQIPRAERARRHRAAAAWIERKAGERVEDLAEVLAHHYLQALELAEAAGDTEAGRRARRAGSALPRARRGAGARPRHRPGGGAARPRARALPGRRSRSGRSCSLRWADAAFQAGRPREAAAALDEALAALPRPRRERGRSTGADPARRASRTYWARAAGRARQPRQSTCSSRSRPARRSSPPTRSSPRRTSSRAHYGEAIAAADRACALAETLGLPEPARALGAPRQRPCLPRRSGRPRRDGTGAPHAHRAGRRQPSRHSPEQPRHRPLPAPGACPLARRLRAGDRLLRAARPRQPWRRRWRPTAPACSSSSAARRRRSSEPVRSLLPSRRAAEHGCLFGCARSSWRPTSLAARRRARPASPTGSSRLRARRPRQTQPSRCFAAVAAARLAAGAPDQARALLAEIEQTPGARDTPYYSRQLGAMLRTALAAGDPDLARAARGRARTPLPAPRARPLRRPRPTRRTRRRPRRRRSALRRSSRALATVRERPRVRLRASRPGPLPGRSRRPRRRATAPPGGRAVQLDGLPPRPRRDGSAPRADDRAGLLAAPSFCHRLLVPRLRVANLMSRSLDVDS